MVDNIEKILEPGDRIELLVYKTATMQDSAFHFRKQSKRLRRALWMKNFKLLPNNHSPPTLNTLPAGTKKATMRREEDLPLSAPEKHQTKTVQLLHSKRPPCPQTLTLSRFSYNRDSAYPHCAILCYLPTPDEPLQNPFAWPVTTQPTTATTKGKVSTHTSERGENERMFKIFTNKPFAIYNADPASEKTVVVRRSAETLWRRCGDGVRGRRSKYKRSTHSLKIASDPNIDAQAHSRKTASDPKSRFCSHSPHETLISYPFN
ncbi:vesicle-associated membrane protein 7 [Vigna unguiculata]|uniref:Vesicle-associated membrane protein 7 n=1 Tax=Vigna unguiculata TaxID=3917 RepID=A0A4D6NGS3_VIGUN|nr:vesicle-associated membrane protein 7 [Vigna unguiculata]